MGLVLSRALIAKALEGRSAPVAWLLIDDFAELVGHPPGKRADFLVVALTEEEGCPIVDLVVVESKFVSLAAETQEARDAAAQLKATADHFRDSIVLDKDALNRPTWLSRLADLVAEQGFFEGPVGGRDDAAWAAALRSNGTILRICGTALVFTQDRRDGKGEAVAAKSDEQREVLFDRADIAKLVHFVRGESVAPPTLELPPAISSGAAPVAKTALNRRLPKWRRRPHRRRRTRPRPKRARPRRRRWLKRWRLPRLALPLARCPDPSLNSSTRAPRREQKSAGLDWLAATRQKLRVALRNYGFDAEVVGERLTPNAALVRFKGSDQLTATEVAKKQEVLLTSHSLSVISVQRAPGEVVVMVARPERGFPQLPDVWLRRTFADTVPEMNASFVLGERESDGSMVYWNLANGFNGQPQHGPHTLIAGETGSGKGVLTRNIILDICSTNSPKNARIRMIDPKSGGDYPWIGSLPHLDGSLVTTQEEATETLRILVEEMKERYAKITQTTSNIDRYNAKLPRRRADAPHLRFPR